MAGLDKTKQTLAGLDNVKQEVFVPDNIEQPAADQNRRRPSRTRERWPPPAGEGRQTGISTWGHIFDVQSYRVRSIEFLRIRGFTLNQSIHCLLYEQLRMYLFDYQNPVRCDLFTEPRNTTE